jgi:hypothetical protein
MASGRSKHKGPTEATPTLRWAIAHVRPGWDSSLLILTRPPAPGPRVDPDPNPLGVTTMALAEQFTITGSQRLGDDDILRVAQFLAVRDQRCDWPCHNDILRDGNCPRCHLSLGTYVDWVRQGVGTWPL